MKYHFLNFLIFRVQSVWTWSGCVSNGSVSPLAMFPQFCKNFAAVCFSPMTGARLLTSTHHFYVPRYSLAMDKFIDSWPILENCNTCFCKPFQHCSINFKEDTYLLFLFKYCTLCKLDNTASVSTKRSFLNSSRKTALAITKAANIISSTGCTALDYFSHCLV